MRTSPSTLKAWRVRNTGGRFAKTEFRLDFDHGQLTCPHQITMPFQPGRTVRSYTNLHVIARHEILDQQAT